MVCFVTLTYIGMLLRDSGLHTTGRGCFGREGIIDYFNRILKNPDLEMSFFFKKSWKIKQISHNISSRFQSSGVRVYERFRINILAD